MSPVEERLQARLREHRPAVTSAGHGGHLPSGPTASRTPEPSSGSSPDGAAPAAADGHGAADSPTGDASSAGPSSAEPSSAEPSSAEPSSAEPSSAEPSPARLLHADLSDVAPGDALTERLAELPGPAGLDDFSLLEVAAALERQIASLRAEQVEVLAEFARRRSGPLEEDDLGGGPAAASRSARAGGEFGGDEVAARLRWTRWAGEHRLEEAARLAACLPRTWELLADGELDYPRVKEIVNGTLLLCEADAARVDAALADQAPELTTGQLRAAVAREVAAVDATASRRRAKAAAADRGVRVGPLPDGMAELVATGPAPAVRTMIEALTSAAGPAGDGETRSVGARRFDALHDWAVTALSPATDAAEGVSDARRGRGWRPEVLCTVSLTTLLGLDDAPGELAGYGPLPAHLAREMARDGVLRRVLTDPVTGVVVSVDGHTHPEGFAVEPPDPEDPPGGSPPGGGPPGRGDPPGGSPPVEGPPGGSETPARRGDAGSGPFLRVVSCPVARAGGGRYRPGRAMDRFVRVRDQRCTAPGCRMPAVRCDLDHVVRHPDGPTCPCNLHPLCRHHHRLKHLTRTRVARWPDGSTHWVLPTGHEYVRPPTPALPEPRVACRRDPARIEEDPPVPVQPPPWDDAGPGIAALEAAIAAAERAPRPDPWPVDEEPPF